MNKHLSSRNIIEAKLEQLPAADSKLLWNDMYLILDKEMPQKKERRRFIAWFLSGKGLFLLTFASLIMTSSALFLFFTQKSTDLKPEKIAVSQQTNNIIKEDAVKILLTNKENPTIDNKSIDIPSESKASEVSSISSVNYVITNDGPTKYTKQKSGLLTSISEADQQLDAISNPEENSGVHLVRLAPIHKDLQIAPINNDKKISIAQPLTINPGHAKTINSSVEKGFYAGIMMGADLSSVKFQSAKSGATMGFILGYALDPKWSIESGFLWDTKRVYDDGSYFNPPGYTPTNGITIIAVNGKSRLQEWPVNVRYTIRSKNHIFFATTGVSSYFMKQENYDYEYTQNNQPGGHNYLSYKNETKDWFGVLNFGLGYSHKLGANGNIRIEPYFKLPIKNIGTANMPIMSTGLNIGITKPLKR